MDMIEAYARISVARGCGFVVLGVVCVMAALLETPVLALKIGGFFALLIAIFLMVRGQYAHKVSHKNTEVWLMLEDRDRPHSSIAQKVICGILRDVYNEFSLHFARAAAWVFALSIVLDLMGFSAPAA
jgi:Ca2+/Na+ antiporter